MNRRWIQSLGLVVALAVAKGGVADVIYLKGAGKLEGRIIEQNDESVVVDIGAGTMTVPRDRVERIEEGQSALDDYREREAALDPGDSEGWLELANWASNHALGTQARQAYQQVLKTDPENPAANQALGRVQLDGRWVSAEESYRARGYVQFEGQWMTPAEQQSILDERAAWTEAQRARYEADARAREAEARARQAEAEAEAAAEPVYGIPLWWGAWGPGPGYWPQNPQQPRPTPSLGRVH